MTFIPVLLSLSLSAVVQASPYTISYFSGPLGFRLLDSAGINNNGDVAGWGFNDPGGPDSFLRSSVGTISTFGVSHYTDPFTQAFAINDAGEIVGSYIDRAGVHAFLRASNGAIETLHIPYTSFGFTAPYFESASATGINDKDQIVGTFLMLSRMRIST